jgi:hypothetical protein
VGVAKIFDSFQFTEQSCRGECSNVHKMKKKKKAKKNETDRGREISKKKSKPRQGKRR